MFVCAYACVCAYAFVYIYVCARVCVFVCVSIRACERVSVRVHANVRSCEVNHNVSSIACDDVDDLVHVLLQRGRHGCCFGMPLLRVCVGCLFLDRAGPNDAKE